jgi:hypothetical protein
MASTPQVFSVTNMGTPLTGPLGAVTVAGADANEFGVSYNTCTGAVLATGAGCVIAVRFLPTALGPAAAQIQVSASPGGTATAALTGTGGAAPTTTSVTTTTQPSPSSTTLAPATTTSTSTTIPCVNLGGAGSGSPCTVNGDCCSNNCAGGTTCG